MAVQGPRGAFIVLEGADRAGKSTQCAMLVQHLQRQGVSPLAQQCGVWPVWLLRPHLLDTSLWTQGAQRLLTTFSTHIHAPPTHPLPSTPRPKSK
jgi:thymidylate kinase